jgi:hypothetical protein
VVWPSRFAFDAASIRFNAAVASIVNSAPAVTVPLRLSATQEIQHFRSHRSPVTDHLMFVANIA